MRRSGTKWGTVSSRKTNSAGWAVFLLVFTYTLYCNPAAAQNFPSEFWHAGKLVLVEGDTITGEIKYNLETDILQVNASNKVYTFSARKILYFEIFDITVDSYRQFYTIPYKVRPDYKTPVIFEVLHEGELTLLCREEIVTQTNNLNSYYWTGGTYSRKVLDYRYYFMSKDGRIEDYTRRKRDLLRILRKRSSQIKEYIKRNNLKHDTRRDLTRIVSYYNSLN